VSRSGATIAAGLVRGLQPRAAARFSFLLAIPTIGGAALLEMRDVLGGGEAADGIGVDGGRALAVHVLEVALERAPDRVAELAAAAHAASLAK
jgi:undecaprenyl pyrophosphate phosphatase UppP